MNLRRRTDGAVGGEGNAPVPCERNELVLWQVRVQLHLGANRSGKKLMNCESPVTKVERVQRSEHHLIHSRRDPGLRIEVEAAKCQVSNDRASSASCALILAASLQDWTPPCPISIHDNQYPRAKYNMPSTQYLRSMPPHSFLTPRLALSRTHPAHLRIVDERRESLRPEV